MHITKKVKGFFRSRIEYVLNNAKQPGFDRAVSASKACYFLFDGYSLPIKRACSGIRYVISVSVCELHPFGYMNCKDMPLQQEEAYISH